MALIEEIAFLSSSAPLWQCLGSSLDCEPRYDAASFLAG